jgi:hypothetical protein
MVKKRIVHERQEKYEGIELAQSTLSLGRAQKSRMKTLSAIFICLGKRQKKGDFISARMHTSYAHCVHTHKHILVSRRVEPFQTPVNEEIGTDAFRFRFSDWTQ